VGRLILLLALALAGGATAAAPAQRIVSLAPNVTEILFAAGAGARVVGVSEYSNEPAAARSVTRVGDAFRFDYERIAALRPDLAVAWESGTPPDAIQRLRSLGIPVLVLRTFTLEDIARALEAAGSAAGTEQAARAAADRFRGEVRALRQRYSGQRAVRVFVEIDDEPLYTVTDRHLIGEIIALCGGRNVFGDVAGLAPPVDLEAVIARDPQAILSTDDTAPDPARTWSGRPMVAAVRDGNVFRVPGDLVARATPRTVQGVRHVCESLAVARSRLRADGG
jgi:iron complex transport system substrate-binding protein